VSTASALERELACPPSAVLSPTSRETDEDAERGSVIHVFIRSVAAGTPRAIALAQVPAKTDEEKRWKETCEQIDVGAICEGLDEVRAEVAYRIDIAAESARELGVNLGRKYPARGPNDVDGTNDLEGRRPLTRRIVVIDVKTGSPQYVTRCSENPQMRFHAAAQMLVHDADEVEARVCFVDVGGEHDFDTHVFTRFDVDSYLDQLRARRERIARANEAIRAGQPFHVNADPKWCRWCPALISCPHHHALAAAMLGKLKEAHERWGTLTEEERGAATLHAYECRDLSERIIESMKVMATAKPIALAKGKELRATGSGVRVVNAPRERRKGAA
jgi:hypothetical protein